MKQRVLVGLRFFLYGLVCFAGLGLFLQWPNIEITTVSYKLIGYLGLAGGASFVLSYLAGTILVNLFKDLISGAN